VGSAPWTEVLELAEEAGRQAGAAAEAARERAVEAEGTKARRPTREDTDAVRRAARRARFEALDLALALVCAWLRDLAAVAEGAPELALNVDRAERLTEEAAGLDARSARRAAELAMDTRRRLTVNVGEELALEALAFRIEALLAGV
jgi:DNA polymerase-3 subunit delta'